MLKVLVLYYSKGGSVKEMASLIGRGINSVDGVEAILRTVPEVFAEIKTVKPIVPNEGHPYATLDDFESCHGLAMGSPTHFGNMAAAMKSCIENLTPLWFKGALENKPATVFTSSGSIHGGNEATLLSMQLPLMHLGMIIVGIPYSIPSLSKTQSGGTPYGSSHVGGEKNTHAITDDEKKICIAQGERIARIVSKLNHV